MTATYEEFRSEKAIRVDPSGFHVDPDTLNPMLFDWQRLIVRWALKGGKRALFENCGLGKTPQQLAWLQGVSENTDAPGLILAPLAVAEQTALAEGPKFGFEVTLCESQADVKAGINITNYEKLHRFNPAEFSGIVLDESSILKSFEGKTRQLITELFADTPYKLCCTATPAPNDHMELGTHAEFLGIMTRVEMLATFFTHDGGETSKWRLKGHAEETFWKWVASWAVVLRKPSDLGFSDEGFELPPLILHEHVLPGVAAPGQLFPTEAQTLNERRGARKASLTGRVEKAAGLVNGSAFLFWCDFNAESESLAKTIPDAAEVTGSQPSDMKARLMLGFTKGDPRILVSKSSICGFGMNWQHCHNMAFVGLSDSFEAYYQAVRRCWRFGQTEAVNVHIITSENEGAVVANIKRKEREAEEMYQGMAEHTKRYVAENLHGADRDRDTYREEKATGKKWTMHLGDCVEVTERMPADSVHYTIFSPPFSSLYTYSNSERDMGNCRDDEEFFRHLWFLAAELYRVTMPGRLLSFHCMNLPSTKTRDGFIGIRDFRGDLIRLFQQAGFIFHSEVCIWKDPVTAMQRTKAIGLLHKQLCKDSTLSRQGIPDYLVTMRKPGVNPEPVAGDLVKKYIDANMSPKQIAKELNAVSGGNLSIDLWQRYASPVWMDIKPSNTLQRESAREEKDERHICPLQLDVIERGIILWSNPNDVVSSPFAGIGSELYQAVLMGRRGEGAELKESYWKQACANLRAAEEKAALPVFDFSGSATE